MNQEIFYLEERDEIVEREEPRYLEARVGIANPNSGDIWKDAFYFTITRVKSDVYRVQGSRIDEPSRISDESLDILDSPFEVLDYDFEVDASDLDYSDKELFKYEILSRLDT